MVVSLNHITGNLAKVRSALNDIQQDIGTFLSQLDPLANAPPLDPKVQGIVRSKIHATCISMLDCLSGLMSISQKISKNNVPNRQLARQIAEKSYSDEIIELSQSPGWLGCVDKADLDQYLGVQMSFDAALYETAMDFLLNHIHYGS